VALSTGGRNTLSWKEKMELIAMKQGPRRGFGAAEKTKLWDRWQRGQPLKAIGRVFGYRRRECAEVRLVAYDLLA
jgi:hypothetical protein